MNLDTLTRRTAKQTRNAVSTANRRAESLQAPSGEVPMVALAESLQAVVFADGNSCIDMAEYGEPFCLGSGTILAVRDVDGSVHLTPIGKTSKWSNSKEFQAVLTAMRETTA